MVTTRNRALSPSQVDPALSTLPPPRQPSHQASRSHHTEQEPPPPTTHQLLQMLERQERLIQEQAELIKQLQKPELKTTNPHERPIQEIHREESAGESYIPSYPTNQSPNVPHHHCGARHPFTSTIMACPLPSHFTRPTNIDQYDGTTDPQDHLDSFEASMLFHGATDPIMCRAFPLTLKKAALQWFTRLTPNSISTWATLASSFNTRFTASKEQPRSSYTLSGIRQVPQESIRAYLDRFNTEAMKVCTLSPEVVVHVLVMGLQEGLFRTELAKYTDLTMEDLRSKTQQFINLEETHHIHNHPEPQTHHSSREAKRPRPHDHPRDLPPQPKKSKYSAYTPLNASRSRILQEVLTTHLVQLPRPRPAKPGPQDRSKYCEYHSMFGHLTNDCTQLRDTIEDLIQAGHLQRFIAGLEQRRRSPQRRRPESTGRRSPPPAHQRRPVARDYLDRRRQDNQRQRSPVDINTISGGFAAWGTSRSAQKRYVREVMHVSARSSHHEHHNTSPPITFDDRDYEGVVRGHDDPLVITAKLNNKKVSRLFVDQGSSADIIFQELFQKMELRDRDLQPYDGQLVGFSRQGITPRGYVEVWLTIGDHPLSRTIQTRFLVVHCESAYNAIVGRPTLKRLKAIVSTPHLCMKFLSSSLQVCTVRGDQYSARSCYQMSLRPHFSKQQTPPSKNSRGVHMVELDIRADEGEFRPQPEGEKITLQLGRSPGQVVYLGRTLPAEQRLKLETSLRENRDLFAWSAADMPGIDPSVICHKLTTNPGAKPVAQRRRKMGADRIKEVASKVAELLEAGFFREITYTT
ncbi:unnamed protein product [Lupinus luteus]|uniref:Retrotransposon gag domain-containing protein n=1 Tax=Lupinus luteus TaxID=3873 RepID=A0AAV1Y556_LUPLU